MRHVLRSRHWREGLMLMRISSILTNGLIKAWCIRRSIVIISVVMLTHGINKGGLMLLLMLLMSVAVREWILFIFIVDSTTGSSITSHWSATMAVFLVLLTLLFQLALLIQAMFIQSLLDQALFLPEADASDCQCY